MYAIKSQNISEQWRNFKEVVTRTITKTLVDKKKHNKKGIY